MLLRHIIKSAKVSPETLRKLFNYGLPAGAGLGTAAYAHSQGQPWDMSAGYGMGATVFASPNGWKKIHDLAKADKDYLGAFGSGGLKALSAKALPAAGMAGLHYVPNILKNVDTTTKAIANTATNTDQITSEAGKIAPNFTKNLNDTMSGINQFWDPNNGQAKQVTDAITGASKGIDRASQSLGTLGETTGQLGSAANRIGDAATGIQRLAERGVGAVDTLSQDAHNAATSVGRHKLLLGALLASGLLGGGAYLHHRATKKNNK